MGEFLIVLPLQFVCPSLCDVHHESMADEIESSSDETCLPDYVAPDSYVPTSAAPYVTLMSDPRVCQVEQ